MANQNLHSDANTASTKSPTSARNHQRPRRTYVYKMTMDDGVAPCAPAATSTTPALLTLAICKPDIRRTAKPGDRLFGITSISIAKSQGYPLKAIIYSAVVASVISSQSYAQPAYSDRLDSIYTLDTTTGHLIHRTTTNIHPSPQDQATDLGDYPWYKNARVLLCNDFRYFGDQAVRIPPSFPQLLSVSQSLKQGHRVFKEGKDTVRELEVLAGELWQRETRYTPDQLSVGGSRRRGSGEQTDAGKRHTPNQLIAGGSRRGGSGKQAHAKETHISNRSIAGVRRRCGSGKQTDVGAKERQALKGRQRLGWKRRRRC